MRYACKRIAEMVGSSQFRDIVMFSMEFSSTGVCNRISVCAKNSQKWSKQKH